MRNHQPESRMLEICLSGSEGGAALTRRPYPYPRARTETYLLEQSPIEPRAEVGAAAIDEGGRARGVG
jgi:hypothetical protein